MIQVNSIKKSYSKKPILEDISFEVCPGSIVSVVGKNGCGKTTLMKILAGVMKPKQGQVIYYKNNMWDNPNLFSEYTGYVPQDNPLIEELTVMDNFKLWGYQENFHTSQLITMFQLEEMRKIRVHKLSGGMKRRLSIACAMIHNPSILILDEPTTALDLYYKESIHNILAEFKKANGIVIMTTHDEQEILGSDVCLLMKDGKITQKLNQEDVTLTGIKEFIQS